MQFGGGKPPVGVIYDSDFGNRIDDALAMALMYALDGKNECRVVSVSISKPSLKAAALSEVIGRFYAGAVSGNFGAVGRTLPVGMATESSVSANDTPMITQVLTAQTAEGKPKYTHGVNSLNDTADPRALIRNAFTSQHDQNCMVVVAGPATNLAATLALPGVRNLVERKVRYLVMMGGDFSANAAPEANIKADIAAARKVLADWPTEVIFAGQEIGAAVPFPGAIIETDLAWSQAHPVADAYRASGSMPYDTPSWDMTAMLHAVRPGEKYFQVSDAGNILIDDAGRTRLVPASGGRHRHLIFDPAQKEKIQAVYKELISAKPVVRQRFRPQPPPQQQQKPPEPPKPPASK